MAVVIYNTIRDKQTAIYLFPDCFLTTRCSNIPHTGAGTGTLKVGHIAWLGSGLDLAGVWHRSAETLARGRSQIADVAHHTDRKPGAVENRLNRRSRIRLAPLERETEGLSNRLPVCCVKLRLFSFKVLLSFTGHSPGSNGGPCF